MSIKAKNAFENSHPRKPKAHVRVGEAATRMNSKTKAIIVEVTEKEYQADLVRGLQEDEVLKPGRHRFKRGSFLARHGRPPGHASTSIKVHVPLDLDLDVLKYFKRRAAAPHASSYQTQINAALRAAMEIEKGETAGGVSIQVEALLADQRFIEAVAKRVIGRRPSPRKRRRRAA
ncbi:MAG: BrnA antitoxin family protein [Acidobacteria bacterium]|nr:BrnA antitoxin family protein [Acidobacteriota bacterium]MBI3658808.1 BrnA antitoxin family protein [Acidobacteriota bacterium]